ncbi:hypothetical protein [Microbacterium sp. LWS13-1.2]|uniref:DUF222 domain-containing protein n=1 Tax=Microbacterium sp. LWS13-1.2 TaxID=3135264 RepID=A0AAU6SGL7_9MICO
MTTITDHPSHWPEAVVDTYDGTLDLLPELAGPAFASLVEACELLATAYALDEVATAAGHTSTGSMGQVVLHPAVTEARLVRTAAASILSKLVPPTSRAQRMARGRHGGTR